MDTSCYFVIVAIGDFDMQITKLRLFNFRNFENFSYDFLPGLTVITGANGMGKTNLLEAIYLCCIAKSPRTHKDAVLIHDGSKAAKIELEFVKANVCAKIQMVLGEGNKQVYVNGQKIRLAELVGKLGCVYFSPDEIEIVRGAPSNRRKYLDIISCQMSQTYMDDLRNYQKSLKQRNALLKSGQLSTVYDELLTSWDMQIIDYSYRIMKARKKLVDRLHVLVDKIMPDLSDNKERLELAYKTFVDVDNLSLESVRKAYMHHAYRYYAKECEVGITSCGIHNDDVVMNLVGVNNKIDLRNQGSLGQQRCATLALKIAEMYIAQEHYGDEPILLLDDVLSELDKTRRQKLLDYCVKFNTIMTCTEWEKHETTADNLLLLKDGKLSKIIH